jgi:hypothetical protein
MATGSESASSLHEQVQVQTVDVIGSIARSRGSIWLYLTCTQWIAAKSTSCSSSKLELASTIVLLLSRSYVHPCLLGVSRKKFASLAQLLYVRMYSYMYCTLTQALKEAVLQDRNRFL